MWKKAAMMGLMMLALTGCAQAEPEPEQSPDYGQMSIDHQARQIERTLFVSGVIANDTVISSDHPGSYVVSTSEGRRADEERIVDVSRRMAQEAHRMGAEVKEVTFHLGGARLRVECVDTACYKTQ